MPVNTPVAETITRVELHVTDTGKYHLLCLRVCLDCEAMIFVSELCKAGDDLIFVALLRRNDGLGKTRLRELDLRKFYDTCAVADSIVCICVGELGSCADIACRDAVCGDLLLVQTQFHVDIR